MATLKSLHGDVILVHARHLIGRSRAMHTRLTEAAASGEHAVLTWSGAAWTVRDLGSRNGTLVDGVKITPGVAVPIEAGAELTFGAPGLRYTLLTASPPAPSAQRGDQILEGEEDVLAIPSPDDPQVIITFDLRQGWTVMRDGTATPLGEPAGGEPLVVEVNGEAWTIDIPEAITPTADVTRPPVQGPASLRFRVSADEEYLELALHAGDVVHPLKPRAHQHVLLLLARERLRDAAAGVPAAEQGWVYTADLAQMTGSNANQLYVSLHRARKELDDLGLLGVTSVLERRATTRQVRIAVGELVVQPI